MPAKPARRRVGFTITHKLVTMVVANITVILLLLAGVLLALHTSAGVRGYVGGEGLWSKGQKDAVYYLNRYLRTAQEGDWQNYEQSVTLPLGIRTARLEMEKPAFDRQIVTDAFASGGIAVEDVPPMIFLFRNFQNVSYFANAIAIWREADDQIDRLTAVAQRARSLMKTAKPAPDQQQKLLAEVHAINTQLTPLEREFSAVLARGARAVQELLMVGILTIALVLVGIKLWLNLRIAAGLRSGIVGLRDGTQAVTQGDFAYRIHRHGNDELGDLAEMFNSMIDRRQQAEQQLRAASELQEKILDSSTNAIYAMDREGLFTMVNRRTCEITGYAREELLGQPFGKLFEPEQAAELKRRYTALIKGEGPILNYEVPLVQKDGSRIVIVFSTTALSSERLIVGATGAAEDITERKRTAEKLLAHTEELARSNKELEQFAYVASHDLQEPLRSISSFAQLLGKRYKGQLGEEADEYIGFISESIKRMKTLLEDLLAFSKVAGGNQEMKTIAMGAALKAAQANLQAAISSTDAMITFDDMPTVTANLGNMTQLLQNLLANAIKFRGKSTPLIHVGAKPEGEHWHFTVADNGIGINKDSAERIFVLFQRLHTLDQYPGNGIGLTICKKIVELHHGRIWAEPGEKGGTVFHFTLRA